MIVATVNTHSLIESVMNTLTNVYRCDPTQGHQRSKIISTVTKQHNVATLRSLAHHTVVIK